MEDSDLKNINLADIPPPSPGAKQAAINAAVSAFESQKNKSLPKGNVETGRLMASVMNRTWEWFMQPSKALGAVAAGLILFPAAILLTWQHYDPDLKLFNGQELRDQENTAKREEKEADANRIVISELSPKPSNEYKSGTKPGQETQKSPNNNSQNQGPVTITGLTGANSQHHGARDGTLQSMAAKPAAKVRSLEQARVGRTNNGPMNFFSDADRLPSTKLRPPVGHVGKNDRFTSFQSNPLKSVVDVPVSTFSIDVDTSSYAFIRRQLESGRMPSPQQVRVEEMINYFSYDYPRPEGKEVPFRNTISVFPTPWNPKTKLLHIGLKGYDVIPAEKPQSNLVFLIDVSGSMNSPDKLPLLKNAFRLLVDQLTPEDTVSIVTYAGNAGTVLEPTKVAEKFKILQALDSLRPGGSTAGAQGITQAYALANSAYKRGGVNRIILATDGDFNVGISDADSLKQLIEKKRKSGIFLSVLGFGRGNYNDAIMQTLAQNGNGTAAYIDNLREAHKVLVQESSSTLFNIAKDVKIQIEFNPKMVSEYRLIGYETRFLNKQDFNNDQVDAGDIGSGHTVTAIYEITPADGSAQLVDKLRYQNVDRPAVPSGDGAKDQEYAFLKMRYKLPDETKSRLISVAITSEHEHAALDSLSDDVKFSTGVAAFGQKLRGSTYLIDYNYDEIITLAGSSLGNDKFGYRHEFLGLIRLAKSLEIADLPRRQ